MNALKLIQKLSQIMEEEKTTNVSFGWDCINDKDYITLMVDGKYRRYTLDWRRVE